MDVEIKALSKQKWKGQILPIGYSTRQVYNVSVDEGDGFSISITPSQINVPVVHTPDEYDYPDPAVRRVSRERVRVGSRVGRKAARGN